MWSFISSLTVCLFQFHKGTIKTYIFLLKLGEFNIFQFHKGTIKTYFMSLSDEFTAISIP